MIHHDVIFLPYTQMKKKGVTSHPLHVTKAIFLNDRRNECDISLDSVLLLLWCEALGAVGFPPTSCGYPLLCRLVSLSSFVETIGSVQSVCVCVCACGQY